MKALVLEGIRRLAVQNLPDPRPTPGGLIMKVMANGVCRSDWHAWMGNTPRNYPIVLGHEMTGIVVETTPEVRTFVPGDRVVVPFSNSDGTCEYCRSGNPHLCDSMEAPGRTYNGGYGELVCVPAADRNLIHLPEAISFTDGAALGCRFMTSFHGLVDRACVRAGEWVVVFGCGGIGLSAINIAAAIGARVIGVDINPANLALAKTMGADVVIDGRGTDVVEAVRDLTKGGAHVSVDALGSAITCVNGIRSLRKSGRHLQIGLTAKKEGGLIEVPVDLVVFRELQIVGTIGMAPYRFASMVPLIESGRLAPGRMVTGQIALSAVEGVLQEMTRSAVSGTYVVTEFQS